MTGSMLKHTMTDSTYSLNTTINSGAILSLSSKKLIQGSQV